MAKPEKSKPAAGTQSSLREIALSEQRYRTLFECARDAILVFDRQLAIIDANPRACEMFGHGKDQLIGMIVDSLQPARASEQKLKVKERFETEALSHEGRVMNVEVSLTRFNAGGKIRFLAIIRDITEHKQTIEKLNAREETVRAIINASVEPMMLLDTAGVILNLNQTAAMRLGAECQDLIGCNSFTLLDKEQAEQRRNYVDIVLQWSMPVRFEEYTDGIHFETTIHPVFGEGGTIERLAVFSRDATIWKNKERHLTVKEMRYRTVFNCLSCAAILVDGEAGIIREANDQAERLTGRVRGELQEMHISELFEHDFLHRCFNFSEATKEEPCSETMTASLGAIDGNTVEVVMHVRKFWMVDEPFILIEMHDLAHLRSVWGKMQQA